MKNIKGSLVKKENPDDLEARIRTLENQIEFIGERLEAWVLDQDRQELERTEYRESLEGKLRELENQLGNIPEHVAEDADTTIWATIASLSQTNKESEKFADSKVWKRLVQEFKSL